MDLILGSKLLTNVNETYPLARGVIVIPTRDTSDLTFFFWRYGIVMPLNSGLFTLLPIPIYDLYFVSMALTAVQYSKISRFFINGIGILHTFCITLLVVPKS